MSFRSAPRCAPRLLQTFEGDTQCEHAALYRAKNQNSRIGELWIPLTPPSVSPTGPRQNGTFEFDADYADWSSSTPSPSAGKKASLARCNKTFLCGSAGRKAGITNSAPTYTFDKRLARQAPAHLQRKFTCRDTYYTPVARTCDGHFLASAWRNGTKFDFDITYQVGYGPDRNVLRQFTSATPGFFADKMATALTRSSVHAILVSVGNALLVNRPTIKRLSFYTKLEPTEKLASWLIN